MRTLFQRRHERGAYNMAELRHMDIGGDATYFGLSRDFTKRCHWLQQFCLMNIFQHVGKPAIIAAYCMQKLHAIIAHETKSKIIVQFFQPPYARIAAYSMQ